MTKKLNGEPVVCVTAYDALSAELAQAAEVDVVLVGDSLGNVVLGYPTTVPVTMEDMIHHLAAVRRFVNGPLLVADLPFGSYNVSTEQAIENSIRLMKAGAEAVKLEGDYPQAVEGIVRAGIPVMGHVGFTPQSVHRFGGHRVQGRGETGSSIQEVCLSLQHAGVFSIVLELMPADLSKTITEQLRIPTIGIGAGAHCDGQIQVFHDIMGLTNLRLKHAKQYVNGREQMLQAMETYVAEVKTKQFPTEDNSF